MEMENEIGKENESGSHGKGCLKLFGVEISTNISDEGERMKKSLSMGDLESSINQNIENDDNLGYLSDGLLLSNTLKAAHHHKKKVIQWSREEHQKFLVGLKEVGRGNWKEIATKFVKTRTTSQVASHAQKYYLRQRARHERKGRPSVFDMPLEPAAALASPSSSSSPLNRNTASIPQQASTSGGLNTHPSNFHGVPYMVRVLPHNMVGSQSFVADRFAPALSCVPMMILPGPAALAFLRNSHRKFATAAPVTDLHPDQ